jgi:hypothetical protein
MAKPPQWSTAASRPTRSQGLGLVALVLAIYFGPVGLVMALVVLSRGRSLKNTDRICAMVGLVIGAVWTLGCGILGLVSLSGTKT